VAIVKVPLTVAVVPDAVFEKLKVADPAPPLIWSSSFSVSSIMISIGILHISHLRMRGSHTSLARKALGFSALSSSSPRRTKDACSCGPAGHRSASKSAATCAGWDAKIASRKRIAVDGTTHSHTALNRRFTLE
jgi:hypothetical protein